MAISLTSVIWSTIQTNLGSLNEAEPCHFQVVAKATYGTAGVGYKIIPEEDEIRWASFGLTLDPNTGFIMGKLLPIEINQTFTFTVRAFYKGNTEIYSDRSFSIAFVKKYGEPTCELSCSLYGAQRLAFEDWVHSDLFQQEVVQDKLLYRYGDPNFARRSSVLMYVLGGIRVTPTLRDDLEEIIYSDDSPIKPIKVIAGDFKFQKVLDSSGNRIYDVIYLELYDPNHKAKFPSSAPIVHPSIGTWREYLIYHNLLLSEECTPGWMQGNPYIFCLEVAHVKAGYGKLVIDNMTNIGTVSKFKNQSFIMDRFIARDFTIPNEPNQFFLTFKGQDK